MVLMGHDNLKEAERAAELIPVKRASQWPSSGIITKIEPTNLYLSTVKDKPNGEWKVMMNYNKKLIPEAYFSPLMREYIQPKVVKEFPLEGISEGDAFTFANHIAKEVTDFTHGIHPYPAKFIPQIPRWAFKYSKLKPNAVVFDPFVGSGTTLVEARLFRLNSYGIEVNPLGRLMSEVKSSSLFMEKPARIFSLSKELFLNIKNDKTEINFDEEDIRSKFPSNWRFWIPEELMKQLLKIKKNILYYSPSSKLGISEDEIRKLKNFFLVVFSSIFKKGTYFDERQIKVRKDPAKFNRGYPDMMRVFWDSLKKNQENIYNFTIKVRKDNSFAKVIGENAQEIALPDSSVDLIITSPQYLNAIDYPMAHKYNLFALDLVTPNQYKQHCRNYIGMTERAVKSKDYVKLRLTGYDEIDDLIKLIYSGGSATDKNRAFIMYQYFTGMKTVLKQCFRVLKTNSNSIYFVGDNRIRKTYVPTAELLRLIAKDVGFSSVIAFKHFYKNVRLKVNRNETGGKIPYETAIVLKK